MTLMGASRQRRWTFDETMLWRRRFRLWLADHPGTKANVMAWRAFRQWNSLEPPHENTLEKWFGTFAVFATEREGVLRDIALRHGYGRGLPR